MRILISPNAFKGTLSPWEAAEAIESGAARAVPGAKFSLCPVADGGDGLTEVLARKFNGRLVYAEADDLLGKRIRAPYCVLEGGREAVIETARVCGLALLKGRSPDPMGASSYGVGEVILHAAAGGVRKIYVGLGGSGTNDGGAGMAEALGYEFYDRRGNRLARGAGPLAGLARIDSSRVSPSVRGVQVKALADVRNKLLGPKGSARVFGPQKGASREQVLMMGAGLVKYSAAIRKCLGRDVGHIPGSAAAGGISAGLSAFLGAEIVNGADFVLERLGFERALSGCDMVITGEGCADGQTFYGKAPAAVAALARKHGKPVVFLSGMKKDLSRAALNKKGVILLFSSDDAGVSKEDSMNCPARSLKTVSEAALRLVFQSGAVSGWR